MTLGDATDVAKEAVKGLSSSPVMLLVMLLNIVMIVGVGYVARSQQEERRELRADDQGLIKILTEQCNNGEKR